MIRIDLSGHLRLGEQLRLLGLTPAERRRIHRRIGREVAKRLKDKVSWFYRREYPGREGGAERRRLTRKVRAAVGWRASAADVLLYDKEAARQAALLRRRGDPPTDEQIRALREEVGFRLTPSYLKLRFTLGLAGAIIRRHRQGRRAAGELRKYRRKQAGQGQQYFLLSDLLDDYLEEVVAASRIAEIVREELVRKLRAA